MIILFNICQQDLAAGLNYRVDTETLSVRFVRDFSSKRETLTVDYPRGFEPGYELMRMGRRSRDRIWLSARDAFGWRLSGRVASLDLSDSLGI